MNEINGEYERISRINFLYSANVGIRMNGLTKTQKQSVKPTIPHFI
jgi:hypothetical protein